MSRVGKESAIRCRHTLDSGLLENLTKLLLSLPERSPDLLMEIGLAKQDFPLYFSAAIQSIRGTMAATTASKRRFLETILDVMRKNNAIRNWEFVGTRGRQDYRVTLMRGRVICIEAKGCPDGNNMNIWDRPAWAEEFIVWSQCPESLANQPGDGVWSGIAVRLLTKMAVEKQQIDAFVFYDGRCGSSQRSCWKNYGISDIRSTATDIPGEGSRNWLPPPCIYLFPRTVPNPRTNPRPTLHTLQTCRFADVLLAAFNVPQPSRKGYTHWAGIEVKQDERGIYKRIEIGHELGGASVLTGEWTKLKRE